MNTLLIFGAGYTGSALASLAVSAFDVALTSRTAAAIVPPPGVRVVSFDECDAEIARATHVVVTAAPDGDGDPTMARHAAALRAAPLLRWIAYLSTTGVYGDRVGGWVDEDTPPKPSSERAHRRVAAERAWSEFAGGAAVDLCRLAGIYGPGRSAIDDLRAGHVRRVSKPGHAFGRIHRDDIAGGLLAAALAPPPPGVRVLNFSDDLPAESADVIAYAATLLGIDPPPAVPFDDARATMSPMALSFWSENRKVASARTQARLGRPWALPTYRAGLRAILAGESGQ